MAEALGDMVLAWHSAEDFLVGCFAAILGTEHYKASRLYQKLPNFRSRTQALLMLIELHPEFEPVQPFILKLSSLSKTRNNWIHGVMLMPFLGIRTPDDLRDLRAVDLDEPLTSKRRSKPIKPADIRNHADAVRKVALDLNAALSGLPAYAAWSEEILLKLTKGSNRQDSPPAAPNPQQGTED